MHLVLIPAGNFMMGSPVGERDHIAIEGPQHLVRITKSFYMGKYEVTQKEWETMTGSNPSRPKGPNLPVDTISDLQCESFLKILRQTLGTTGVYKFFIPTEAQWEYACRAGSVSAYCFGSNESELEKYAWYARPDSQHHPVGKKRPNEWGLYDMHGNICEKCFDVSDYSNRTQKDPVGVAPTGWRGGIAYVKHVAAYNRSAYRNKGKGGSSSRGDAHSGLRVILTVR
jgi:formylglycine-generating enzyme required for sulfatase activity